MVADVEIVESNGSTPTLTIVSNVNMGSADVPNMVAEAYPIVPGSRSYVKWQRFHVISMGGASQVRYFKIWVSQNLVTGATLYSNATFASYNPATPFIAPSSGQYYWARYPVLTECPATATLGVNGATTNSLSASTPYSDYLAMQIRTDPSTLQGIVVTLNYQYEEIA